MTSLGVEIVAQKINLPLILSSTKEAISEKTSSSAFFLPIKKAGKQTKNFSESFNHRIKAPSYFMVRQARPSSQTAM